jgi:acetyltransferase-like isoleucine patch superfamily enzyme
MELRSLVIGMGEIGSALKEVLASKYPVKSYDINKDNQDNFPLLCNDILHICIPYSDDFVYIVQDYIDKVQPEYTIIHSSVPVGTCAKLKGKIFHSPVRATHPHIKSGLLNFVKYISYDGLDQADIEAVCNYFEEVAIRTKFIHDTKTTELMKLLELCRYGVYLAFAKEQERICEHFGIDYNRAYTEFEETSNNGLILEGRMNMCQPVLYPFKDFVGGHCTTENMELMLSQIETPLLKEALKIDRGTTIWPNCNIYPGAKIGKGCSIGQFTEIDGGVVIGNNVRVGAFCFIPSGVTIEDNCFIAPRVAFSNDKHPPSDKKQWAKTLVKKGAVIGIGSVILPGITIGENAVVGAGSVVTKDIPDNEVWYGQGAYKHNLKEEVYEDSGHKRP